MDKLFCLTPFLCFYSCTKCGFIKRCLKDWGAAQAKIQVQFSTQHAHDDIAVPPDRRLHTLRRLPRGRKGYGMYPWEQIARSATIQHGERPVCPLKAFRRSYSLVV